MVAVGNWMVFILKLYIITKLIPDEIFFELTKDEFVANDKNRDL